MLATSPSNPDSHATMPAWLATSDQTAATAIHPTSLNSIRAHSDWLAVAANAACLVFAIALGFAYHSMNQALVWGLPMFLASALVTRIQAGQSLTMHLNAALLVGQAALHVHLGRGLIEYHFSFFMLMPIMLAYRDVRPLVSMGGFILFHHVLFDWLQQAGFDCYVFRGPLSGWPAISLHAFYVVVEVGLLSVIARTLQQHALAAEESAQLLAHLNTDHGVNLRARAQANEQGELSAVGRMFNDYANHMSFVIAAFKMLRSDVRELADIAHDLGNGNQMHQDDSQLASRQLNDFVQQLGQQTRLAQSTAELSKKVTNDCFDLVNDLNQSFEQLQRMGAQAFECRQQLNQLLRQADEQGTHSEPVSAQSLHVLRAGLDSMNERTQGFLVNMELLKSGLSAIENQAVSVDRATHQWVENGHHNQRQGWEVLGALEQVQTRAERVFTTLNNTIETILRADNLMREMERRLAKFSV
ncbi:hypothetical protein NQT62_01365 [Limnobacter humi]|uniref:Methyl-accepting chemotaxis protein n=1 Tax=Limnobacter humi TaxID=1778671 RepID=A0ABT1WC41_9BURK|nr:hypothetical protein [Limnobacter humi]MCQ8895084.1 hypothetical protein [Limnobacter humi]